MSEVPEHPPLLYFPDAQLPQAVHVVSSAVFWLLLPAVKYCPLGHVVALGLQAVAVLVLVLNFPLPQAVHVVSDVPEHPPLLYLPDLQAVHRVHLLSSVTPETSVKNSFAPQVDRLSGHSANNLLSVVKYACGRVPWNPAPRSCVYEVHRLKSVGGYVAPVRMVATWSFVVEPVS